jgi:sugar phosphate isomerase/epimerase
MKLGAMDVVLKPGEDAAVFERARRLGLDGVEINLRVADLSEAEHPRLRALRDLAQTHQIAIPSTVLEEHNNGGLASWWRGGDADEEVRQGIRWTAALGAKVLLVPFFFVNEPKGRTHRAAVAKRLRPLCAEAETAGVTVAFEGVMSAVLLREMADDIASGGFGVYFDVANCTWWDGDAPAEIQTLGPLLAQCHAKEALVFTGDARLGAGRVDHAACATALRAIGYDRWIVLESPPGEDEQVAQDVAFARRVYLEQP